MVERILAVEVMWVLDGACSAMQAVAGAAEGLHDFVSSKLAYAHVRFVGDVAVLQGSELGARQGNRRGHFVWIDTWL